MSEITFEKLGLCESLCKSVKALGWEKPSAIQRETLPVAFDNKDLIGLAETGSGKTGAFVLPILQSLLEDHQRLYALILTPTRELAFQIAEQIQALGSSIGVVTTVIVGGVEMMQQAISLAKKPHIIIATPGRIVDHLKNTKGFNLNQIKYLVLDEADRMLSLDFEEEINHILSVIPQERHTYLFSATMTQKVEKLERASLKNPVKIQVSTKYQTVDTLIQQYIFIPAKYKDCYLAYILNEFSGQSSLIFVATCSAVQRVTLMLRNLGFHAVCLHGQMSQTKRLSSFNKFKSGSSNILVATDVASRGLDIPSVDCVFNYDIPSNGKDYIHRVGRTARAGRAGRAINFVTQYDVETYQRIEHLIGKKLDQYPCEEDMVLVLLERVTEAQRIAQIQMKDGVGDDRKKRKNKGFDDFNKEKKSGKKRKV